MEPDQSNVFLIITQSSTKKTKKNRNSSSKKQANDSRRGEEEDFLILCHLYLSPLLIKNMFYCVSFRWSFLHQIQQRGRRCYCVSFRWPFLICFSTCCYALDTLPTVSPILGTVNPILPRKKIFFTVSAIGGPVHKKKPGQHQKKNPTSSRHPLPVKLFKILAALHRTRQSTKKNLANTPADLKKNEIENEKIMGLQRFLLYITAFVVKM